MAQVISCRIYQKLCMLKKKEGNTSTTSAWFNIIMERKIEAGNEKIN